MREQGGQNPAFDRRAGFVLRACLETRRGAVFGEKAGWRDEGGAARGHHGATPKAFASRAKPDGLLRENPPGGGSFVRGRRWFGRHRPLRGDASTSPPWPQPKSLAAAPLVVSKQALSAGGHQISH